MRGRIPGTGPQPGNSTDLGKPATVAATTWLKVEPVANRVDVKLTHPEKARPGQKVEIQIDLRDPQGNPRPGEVTLWLVDQAVLAARQGAARSIRCPTSSPRSSRTSIVRDTRNLVFGFLPFAENPGGDEGGGERRQPARPRHGAPQLQGRALLQPEHPGRRRTARPR